MESPRWAVARQLVEPARLWVRYLPRAWPASELPWASAATGRLGTPLPPAPRPAAPAPPAPADLELDDLLYLPPVADGAASRRDEIARAFAGRGVPLLIHLLPGQAAPDLEPSAPILTLYDPLPRLARGTPPEASLEGLAEAGAAAVLWPLIGGLTDEPELWHRACEVLAAKGVATVQALALDLGPSQRRFLASHGSEERYQALFHRRPPPERRFDAVAQSFGLEPFLERPAGNRGPREESNRRLAGLLSLAGELWLRLGRGAFRGEELFRASRWIEGTSYDVVALAREGNLGVVRQIRGDARRLVEEWSDGGSSAFLDELKQAYASPASPVAAPETREEARDGV